MTEAPARAIVRVVLIVVGVVLALYLVYLLRRPIGWVLTAVFLAVALSGPVNRLNRRMRRGFAITLVYLGLLAVPIALGALIVPPFVREGNNLANDAPSYANDVTDFVQKNRTLRKLNDDYDITDKLQKEAGKLPNKLGGAAKTLRDVGVGIVNSVFALVTILILTAFLLGSGRRWVEAALAHQPPDRAARLRRVLDDGAKAISGYVAGVLLQATIAGILTYIVLSILGVPFRAPLAVLVFVMDLIPLVGATIAAVLVGLVTVFNDFPTTTIIWTVWSIVYQQVENSVIQPRIQQRTVQVNPFVVLVAVLFGATLLGVVGALVAIPAAAIIQIGLREWWDWRGGGDVLAPPPEPPSPPPAAAADEPAPA
ncbi:MAG: AI-2E family transporter [Thermoleophilaceae bacterium]